MKRRTTRMGSSRCTNCGREHDALTSASASGDAKPEPGSMAVCIICGHVMILDDQLKLRDPTEDELIEIAGDEGLRNAVNALGAARADYERRTGKPWDDDPTEGKRR